MTSSKHETAAHKATWLSCLGAGFEYYDFVVYGMMAEIFSKLFFVDEDPFVSLLKTFAIFAMGYIARPLGGIFFGSMADRYGRKKVFASVMFLMATATFIIGLLPTYSQLKGYAPILLLFCRLLQGLSFGAELPGAMTVVSEYTSKKKHGVYAGFVLSSTCVGAALASFVLYFLSTFFSREAIFEWAWRIPFLFGGLLAIISYHMRRHLHETPEFIELENSKHAIEKAPAATLLLKHPYLLLQGIGLTAFVSSLVIFALYLPTYLPMHFGYASADIYLTTTIGMIWAGILLPIAGRFSDKIGGEKLIVFTIVAFCLSAFPLFFLLHIQSFLGLLLFTLLYQGFIALISVSYFPQLISLFPTQLRYTGIGASYNMTYSMMSMLPFLLTVLIHVTHSVYSPIWVLIGFACLTLISVLFPWPFHALLKKPKRI